ncbi:MAG: Bug family tripartite tricarboxylate transporter substrate binding protein [Burkholderiales bacterium]
MSGAATNALHAICVGLFLCLTQGLVLAQNATLIPGKPVRLVIPAAPGGNPDVLARMMAQKLQATLGTPMIVDNQPGAGGVGAAIATAKSTPDGHTLFFGGTGSILIPVALNPKLPIHPLSDFTHITGLAAVPTVLVAHPAVPANNVKEFISFAKTMPGAVNFGSAGVGSTHHLTMAVFESETGTKMLHVPYKGGSPLVAAIMSGEVHAGFSGIPNVIQAVRAGKLKIFGISIIRRSRSIPDVPTLDEQGLKGFDIAANMGVQAAPGLHANLVNAIQAAMARAIREPDIAERMSTLGMELIENGTENYLQSVKAEFAHYVAAVKSGGLKPE